MSSRKLRIGALLLVAALGIWLRCVSVGEMEYKEDEEYHFVQSQKIGQGGYFPWVGIPSGVYVKNPGMSVWIFAAAARLTGASTPTALARAIQIFNVLSIGLLFWLAREWKRSSPRSEIATLWPWIFAWGMVNPFWIYYARKIWPEGFLPAFTLGMLIAWLGRERAGRAFAWGLLGALVGQVHMSGFFMAAGLAAVTWLKPGPRQATHWRGWLAGSVLGALPLLPWLWDWWKTPPHDAITRGWSEIVQLKFWVFWLTQPFGLHLGSAVGINRGPSQWAQLADWVRFPLVAGHPTYLCGLAHAALAGVLAVCLLSGVAPFRTWARSLLRRRRGSRPAAGSSAPAAFWLEGALAWAGGLMTLTGIQIRRYYVAVFFPLDVLSLLIPTLRWRARFPRAWIALLTTGFAAQAIVSYSFVEYVRTHHGAPEGDYGWGYERVLELRQSGKCTPPCTPAIH